MDVPERPLLKGPFTSRPSPDRRAGAPARPVGREPFLAVAPEVAERYGALVLDPLTADRLPYQDALRATVYLADRLLVSGRIDGDARAALDAAAAEKGLRVTAAPADEER